MEKKLGQEDIDALFAAANASAKAKTTEVDKGPEKYVFSRAGQISNDQMRAITTVNDLFARNLMHSLGGWLRTPFRVKLVAGEQLPFSEFLERLSPMTYICSVRLEPLGAVGLLELDLGLVAPIVDVLLGGIGRSSTVRELTDIEETIMRSVVEMVGQELTLAWQPVGLEFVLEKRETEAQAARMMTLGEKTLCVSFEVRMPEIQGGLNLCLPAVVLNAILRRLISEGDRPRRRSKESATRMRESVKDASVEVVLQLPAIKLRASEIAELEPGSILRFAVPKHQRSDLIIGGLFMGKALPVRSGEHRAARLEEMVHVTEQVIQNSPEMTIH
ncbi:flagellar motor switch protein FliM [Edaphobacter albus]|uniref:flagellar motor switch protein FliM n=1 Tax=Edaphobacter sp. 4G125 TaxID=2763071 RepID=UPI0016449FCA|nr:FliM/FliN family flagellar motor switch protein [Edaphobacter sp. 4G125]QNI35281.1 FliM/FliN family flagellar motor switch protein [Edaphobacter sp. 4G125]